MSELYLGALSGTSMNSIDAALFDLSPSPPKLLAHHAIPFPDLLRDKLKALALQPHTLQQIAVTEHALSQCFAQCIHQLLEQCEAKLDEIAAVGVHGQTLLHETTGSVRVSLQLLDPNVIAAQCRMTVISDFRRRDLAEGGEGAPLAPLIHQHLFHHPTQNRAIVNIGGIANITLLPAEGTVRGFDSGPGGGLMDEWCELHQGDLYDGDGQWARSGTVAPPLLEAMLQDPYFSQAPPKSTSREYFNRDWLEGLLDSYPASIQDVQTTLAELTARSIADALSGDDGMNADTVLICGGGARNSWLMERLDALLDADIRATDDYGMDAEWVECCLFAYLASLRLRQEPIDLKAVTGSGKASIGGAIWAA